MHPWYILEFVAGAFGAISIAIAFFVVKKSARDKYLTWIFVVFASTMGLWMLSVVFADLSGSMHSLVFWTKTASIASSLGVASFVVFAILFRKPESNFIKLLICYLPVLILIIYIILFPADKVYLNDPFINRLPHRPVGGVANDQYYGAYIPFLFGYIIWATVVLLLKHKMLPPKIKKQIYYITVGSVLTMLAGIIFDSVLPVFGIDYLYSLGPAFGITLVGGAAYAIIRQELLDIRVIIQRSIIYTLLLGLIILSYLSLVFILGKLFQQMTNTRILLSAMLTVILGIFGVPVLENRFRELTDSWFFKKPYDYASALHLLSQTLNDNLELTKLKNQITLALSKIFKNEFSVLSMDTETEIENSVTIDIKLKDQLIGRLFLGPKLSGDDYTATDKKLLETFAHQAAVALEKARLFEEVKTYSQELEKRVNARTSEIKQLQEQQNQIMIEIAHNLQTPLTVLKSQLESLKIDSNQNLNFPVFEQSLDNISEFIYDLLKYSRLEQKPEIQKTQIDLSRLLEELVEYFRTICEQEKINLIADITPQINILGDEHKLTELITNLLSNSIKYIANQRRIQISLREKDQQVVLEIHDSGIGIPKENLGRLFHPFIRLNNSDKIKGVGLGLAIAKRIADLHDASIEAESTVGVGTVFTIKFTTASNYFSRGSKPPA